MTLKGIAHLHCNTPAPSASLRECEADVAGGARERSAVQVSPPGANTRLAMTKEFVL